MTTQQTPQFISQTDWVLHHSVKPHDNLDHYNFPELNESLVSQILPLETLSGYLNTPVAYTGESAVYDGVTLTAQTLLASSIEQIKDKLSQTKFYLYQAFAFKVGNTTKYCVRYGS